MLELIKGKEKYNKVYDYLQKLSKNNWSFGIKEHSNVCYLIKEVDNVSYVIHILIGDDLSIGDSNILYWISFNSVNEILRSYFLKYEVPFNDRIYTGIDLVTVNNIPEFEKYETWLDSTKPQYKLGSEQSFETIENFITTKTLPFFEQIKTVEDVNEKILNAIEWMRWADYIPGQTYYKALIILKLSKSSNYNSFYLMYKDRLEEHLNNGMPELTDYLGSFILIKEYLDQNY